MKEYLVRGNERMYGMNGNPYTERLLPCIEVNANSVEEALKVGGKRLEERFCINNGNNVRVDLIFDKDNMQTLYESEKIIRKNKERARERFDLHAAIKEGVPIDESGICSCGGGCI